MGCYGRLQFGLSHRVKEINRMAMTSRAGTNGGLECINERLSVSEAADAR